MINFYLPVYSEYPESLMRVIDDELMMKRTPFHIAFCFAAMVLPIITLAQEDSISPDQTGFFERQAWEDAGVEQSLRLSDIEDQEDYWTDQRNFERALKKTCYKNYRAYLKAKSEAYAAHRSECSAQCEHSRYYILHEAFYAQFSGKDMVPQYTSISEVPVKERNLTAVRRKDRR